MMSTRAEKVEWIMLEDYVQIMKNLSCCSLKNSRDLKCHINKRKCTQTYLL